MEPVGVMAGGAEANAVGAGVEVAVAVTDDGRRGAGRRAADGAAARTRQRRVEEEILGKGDGDVEFVVAKAIRDGGIDATIDHDARTMHSSDATDVYSTGEPQAAFHARIAFCLDTHNEAVKAMRYPDKVKKGKGDGERKGRKDRDLEELAMHIMDDDEMDDF